MTLTSMAMAPPCPRSGRVACAQSPTPVRQPSNQGCPGCTCLQADHVLSNVFMCMEHSTFHHCLPDTFAVRHGHAAIYFILSESVRQPSNQGCPGCTCLHHAQNSMWCVRATRACNMA